MSLIKGCMSIRRLIKDEAGHQPDVLILVVLIGVIAAIAVPLFANYMRRGFDAEVKANLENAAKAQAAYYRDNGAYTANIDSLTGFNQSDNVTITVEVTATSMVIAGTRTKGCKANTGTWYLDGSTGAIDGTPCSH